MVKYSSIESNGFIKTKKFAALLAREILKTKFSGKAALVLALSGHLGTGKTTFVQGFMRGAGIRKKITSPTFVLAKRFKIKNLRFKNIYHIDYYRLHKPKELLELGLKEILNNPQNIVLIEWPEVVKRYLPKNIIKIKFEHGKRENERIIYL
ncbi:MAG: ATP-binding protein [Candidatus Wolfebacteria bacterium GW2011_GWA2_42_10]|uniref:tRNA threonylcarbamoyladenosine biosynthesis protein TsaE n=2 Tax=Candidatus Wolfeibacteriota TaxID=1752735 RepID=A0A0G1AJ49_9BACT|nr:MAG: ATP-binding protein [Candidatus Wolfebacteria bacterium GW2011_GWB1_41_12]KKS25308.1 MAG: ATP-binding protein [Candidatus Wolfebacteria bacterium GW2011_GWA2_42_10]KKT56747.1 MAG: ATP-binding protein [Candidatus Wolfebacteria bacterium GW2011_GWA1_44_24]